MMKKGEPVAANPDAYVRRLRGWKKDVVTELRADNEVRIAVNVSNLTIQDSRWLNLLTELMNATPDIAERLLEEWS